jgi:hypothetical protein
LEKPSAEEKARIDAFFLKLATPVNTAKTHAEVTGEVFSPFKIISWVTAGTGAMLVVAGFTQPFGIGQYINLGSGGALFILAFFLYRLHRRFIRGIAENKERKYENEPVPVAE